MMLGVALVGDWGCRREPHKGAKSTASSRKSSRPDKKPKSKAPSPSTDTGKEKPAWKKRKSAKKGGDDKGKKRAAGRKESSPPPPLKGIEFTLKPNWPSFDGANVGTKYRLGYALGDKTSGKFTPKLVVLQWSGRQVESKTVIDRWAGEFVAGNNDQPKPTVKVAEIEVENLNVKLVDISGVYQPSEKQPPRPDYRFIGAIIDHDEGPTVVRAMGPSETIDNYYEQIMEFIRSVRTASKTKSQSKP